MKRDESNQTKESEKDLSEEDTHMDYEEVIYCSWMDVPLTHMPTRPEKFWSSIGALFLVQKIQSAMCKQREHTSLGLGKL